MMWKTYLALAAFAAMICCYITYNVLTMLIALRMWGLL